MIILYILVGLLGLGTVVFIHELGHFIAAKLVGIEVEAFALGWGPPLLSFRRGETEYRLCALPLGGYCKMKGEKIIQKRLENEEVSAEELERSLFSVSPLKRIITYVAGPFANFAIAVLLFSLVWLAGIEYQSFGNRVVLLSDYPELFLDRDDYPATRAGIQSGDRIIAIDGREVNNYRQIQETIAKNARNELLLQIERQGSELQLSLTPELNKSNGTGFIGVSPWVTPLVQEAIPGKPAHLAGIRSGDLITAVDGKEIANQIQLSTEIIRALEDDNRISCTVERDQNLLDLELVIPEEENEAVSLGLEFQSSSYIDRELNPFLALAAGLGDAVEVIVLSLRGIFYMFQGLDMQEAVSGPIRITYTVGQMALFSFSQGFWLGLLSFLRFLSFIHVALCFMNLLPIPALDGGMILYNTVELIRGKPMTVKAFYRFQTIGVIMIGILLFSSIFNDIRYFFIK